MCMVKLNLAKSLNLIFCIKIEMLRLVFIVTSNIYFVVFFCCCF